MLPRATTHAKRLRTPRQTKLVWLRASGRFLYRAILGLQAMFSFCEMQWVRGRRFVTLSIVGP